MRTVVAEPKTRVCPVHVTVGNQIAEAPRPAQQACSLRGNPALLLEHTSGHRPIRGRLRQKRILDRAQGEQSTAAKVSHSIEPLDLEKATATGVDHLRLNARNL